MAKNGFSMSNRSQTPTRVSDDKTLTKDDCGNIFLLDDGTNGLVLTLPSAAEAGAGWNCDIRIIESAASAKTYKISTAGATATTDFFVGGLAMVSTAGTAECLSVSSDGDSNAHINLTHETKGGLVGGHIQVVTDGQLWYVKGTVSGAGTLETPFAD